MVRDPQHKWTFQPLVARWILTGFFAVCPYFIAEAQIDPTGRSGDKPREFTPEGKPPKTPTFKLPPIPSLPEAEAKKLPVPRVRVHKIKIEGGEVFPRNIQEAIAEITKKFEKEHENGEVTFEELEDLRVKLSRYLFEEGFVNSGAILPDQTVENGIITYKIIAGKLSRIDIEFDEDKKDKQQDKKPDENDSSIKLPYVRIRDSYIRKRLRLGAAFPLNVKSLQERLLLLLQNHNIKWMNADLKPGLELGDGVLSVNVQDRQPYSLTTEFNNYQSPTVGSYRGLTTLVSQNLTGFSDELSVQYGRSEGLDPLVDVWYRFPFLLREETFETPFTDFPIGLHETTFQFRYRKNDYGVVEAPFDPLNIQTKSEIFGITARQPFYRTLNQEFAVELIGEHLTSKSSLLGRGFSFYPGTDDGKAVVTALRLAPDYVWRSETQVFAARMRFSFGLPAFGATRNSAPSLPDASFFAWLGQFQWAKRFNFLDIEASLRADLQLTNDSLFPLEQIAIGGRYSVRGYRENQLVRDNGILSQFEIRIPLKFLEFKPWMEVQLAPFMDTGTAWNHALDPGAQTLWSVGVGIRCAATLENVRPAFELYWGYPLRKVPTQSGDLQDDGIHLQFAVSLF
jgi:hemolysin activation/secretion protein